MSLIKKCTLPITGYGEVDIVVTELAMFFFENGKVILKKIASEVDVDYVRRLTEFDFEVTEDLQKMIDSSEIHHDIKHIYHLNDKVIIVDGPLKNVCRVVTKINSKDKLLIDVEIVGRMVSIELDVSKIKKED